MVAVRRSRFTPTSSAWAIGVSIGAGQIAFTRIPWRASSSAALFVMPPAAGLEAGWGMGGGGGGGAGGEGGGAGRAGGRPHDLHAEPHALEVDRDDAVERLLRVVGERAQRAEDAGVVEEDVHAAELLHRRFR